VSYGLATECGSVNNLEAGVTSQKGRFMVSCNTHSRALVGQI